MTRVFLELGAFLLVNIAAEVLYSDGSRAAIYSWRWIVWTLLSTTALLLFRYAGLSPYQWPQP